MTRILSRLNRSQRLIVFFVVFGGTGVLLLAFALNLILSSFAAPRNQAVALVDGVSVTEFVALPDDDAYPASLAVAPDGTVYTASYATGAVWAISPDAVVAELPRSRDLFGSVAGLTTGPDGSLYVVDRLDPRSQPGQALIWRVTTAHQIEEFARIDDAQGFLSPDDIALDSSGWVYVSDRARGEIWRFQPDGSGGLAWWQAPPAEAANQPEPTGLAYDATRDAIIVSDSITNAIYRIPVTTGALAGSAEILYQPDSSDILPGLDGLTVTADGTIYVAALALNQVARLEAGTLIAIAAEFRGASDVAAAGTDRLYVTNWDQFSLAFRFVPSRLPFALDLITLPAKN